MEGLTSGFFYGLPKRDMHDYQISLIGYLDYQMRSTEATGTFLHTVSWTKKSNFDAVGVSYPRKRRSATKMRRRWQLDFFPFFYQDKKRREKRTYVTGISPGPGNSISRWDRKTDEKWQREGLSLQPWNENSCRALARVHIRTYVLSRFQSALYQHLYRYHAYAIIVHAYIRSRIYTRVYTARGILND